MDRRFDVVIIGTGQAGPPLAARAHAAGLDVAIVERDRLGGTCVNVGCTPTKALVGSARAIHNARRGTEFGFVLDSEPVVDMARVKARMRAISEGSSERLGVWLDSMESVEVIRGHARLRSPTEIVIDGRVVAADRIFLNVGARPRVPEYPGLEDIDYLTSSSILDLDELPDHLIIIGGSYIGLEFAQIYRRFGSRVTVVERGPRVISRDDPDVSTAVREALEAEGVEFQMEATCIGFSAHEAGAQVVVDCAEERPPLVGSHVLLAVGRVPNTDDLGLDAAGIERTDRGFVVVDDTLTTTAPNVWAVGDCNGLGAFTHTSYNDHEIVAANLFGGETRKVTDRIPCYGLFVDPPLGRVGMTEAQARESGRRVLVGSRPMKHVGRAIEMGEKTGFMKFLIDADTDEILGGAIYGLNGDEVVHGLLDTMYAKAPYTTISQAVHIHPTVSELIPTTLQDLHPLE